MTVPPSRPSVERRPRIPVLPDEAVPAGLRLGAGFAAFFGTLWLVQGLLPVAGPVTAAAGLLPGLAVAAWLVATRQNRGPGGPGGPGRSAGPRHPAARYVSRATAVQLAVSVPGAVLVQLFVGVDAVLPFVVLTVGVYLLALAPAVRRRHLVVAGAVLTVLPLLTTAGLEGTDRTVATGLVGGTVFLAKAFSDLVVSRRA